MASTLPFSGTRDSKAQNPQPQPPFPMYVLSTTEVARAKCWGHHGGRHDDTDDRRGPCTRGDTRRKESDRKYRHR